MRSDPAGSDGSFANSMKVLLWREQLEAIAAQRFLPPVTVDTDPTNLVLVGTSSNTSPTARPASASSWIVR